MYYLICVICGSRINGFLQFFDQHITTVSAILVILIINIMFKLLPTASGTNLIHFIPSLTFKTSQHVQFVHADELRLVL